MGQNVVTDTVDRLGGVLHAAAVAGVVPETVHRAMRFGRFASAAAVVRIVRKLYPDDPAAALALAGQLAGVDQPPPAESDAGEVGG